MKSEFKSFLNQTPSGCMEWTGVTIKGNGSEKHRYGRFTINGKKVLAHRHAYELAYGSIPPGMCVCHKCDNTKCCNPEHLFIGTHKDNMRDMSLKGRRIGIKIKNPVIGEKTSSAKLTDDSVREIRKLRNQGITTIELGKLFNVSPSVISRVSNKKTWKHI